MWPKVSIVIPTLNAASVLENCLSSIAIQDYPKDKIELIIADGGSNDNTVAIAQKYQAVVVANKLKTGESGKAIGLKASTGDYIALIDSDNVLPDAHWLKQMIDPLINNPDAAGSEPLEYIWRQKDGFIDRYCALIGMNDPLCLFLGNYDRTNLLTGKWTEVAHVEKDFPGYILATFTQKGLPTIGANGTVFRIAFLTAHIKSDYLFDIDILADELLSKGSVNFIKVKNGIIHTFCGSDIAKFARKQNRRIKDFIYHKSIGDRKYNWEKNRKGLIIFMVETVTLLPLVYESIKGYLKKPDSAWFFHPVACWITLWQYGFGYLHSVKSNREVSREGWKQ